MQRLVGCGQSGSGSPAGLGVGGHPISEFAMAAEVLRGCDLWKKKDFERFVHDVGISLSVSRDFF